MKCTFVEITRSLLQAGRFVEAISLMKMRESERQKRLHCEALVGLIHQALEKICAKALPGVSVEEGVRQEGEKIKAQFDFQFFPELNTAALLKYLQGESLLNHVTHRILIARLDYCLSLLNKEENDFFALREGIRKITVYRCRRQVIAALCETIVSARKGAYFTPKEEAILVLLREEYLQAIQRQTERMSYDEALSFLEKHEKDPMLNPLLKAQDFMLRIKFPRTELKWLIKSVQHNVQVNRKDFPDLHTIDSPIEADIIGEMIKVFGGEGVMPVLHEKLMAPDFHPDPPLTAWLLDMRQHYFAKRKIRSEKNTLVRQQCIEKLYLSVKEAKPLSRWFWFQRKSVKEEALYLLQDLYIETLHEQVALFNGLPLEKEALHAIVWQEASKRKEKPHPWQEGNFLEAY